MQIQQGNIKLSTRHLLGDGSTCLAHQQQQQPRLPGSWPRLQLGAGLVCLQYMDSSVGFRHIIRRFAGIMSSQP